MTVGQPSSCPLCGACQKHRIKGPSLACGVRTDVFNKASGSPSTCFERSLGCAGLSDNSVIWFSKDDAAVWFFQLLLFSSPFLSGSCHWLSFREAEHTHHPVLISLLASDRWVVGSLCGLILSLETKGRWCAFRNTQGEMENPSFGHFHTEKDQREKNLSAFWNLEDR